MTARQSLIFVALTACLMLLASIAPAPAYLPGEWSVPAPVRGDPNHIYPADPINENGFQWALAPAGGKGSLPINIFALRLEVPGDLITLGNVSVPFSYGIAGVQMPAGTKVSGIKRLSFDSYYEQVPYQGGACGGGSPRYQLLVDANGNGKADSHDRNVFVYAGPYPNFGNDPLARCPFNTWKHNDLVNVGSELRWDSTQLGGPFYGNQAQAAVQAAGRDVLFVTLVWDSYWLFPGRSIFWADNLRVNQFLLAEPGLSHVCSLLKGQGAPGCSL